MISVGSGSWELSDVELVDGAAACPDCGDRLHVDWDDADAALVACFCGFAAMATRISNLPSGWVAEARREDAREELKEAVAALAWSSDLEEAALGEALLDALHVADLAGVAELAGRAEKLRSATGLRSAGMIRRAVLALLPAPGDA